MSKPDYRPEFKFACAVSSCPAMVEFEGHRCSVHKTWTNGPHDRECYKCRQPIVFGDLWRLIDGDATLPVHSQCVGGKSRTPKHPKSWEKGLGQFA